MLEIATQSRNKAFFHSGKNAETLKQQRPIGEGDQELEKRLVQEELI
jgi:hypothetical protein